MLVFRDDKDSIGSETELVECREVDCCWGGGVVDVVVRKVDDDRGAVCVAGASVGVRVVTCAVVGNGVVVGAAPKVLFWESFKKSEARHK